MDKGELRKYIKGQKALHQANALADSEAIMQKLETDVHFLQAQTVLLYHSLPDEVNTHEFIRKWGQVKTLLLPAVVGDDLELKVYSPSHELPEYVESIRSLQKKYKDKIEIRIGLECEYFPQYMPWLKEQIAQYQLDYVIFGNHYYQSDEDYPYFGVYTTSHEMLSLYEESAIQGMESGIYAYLAHPDLFMASYDQFDEHCERVSRHICRTARKLNLPLEYNLGTAPYKEHMAGHTFPHPSFWQIAKDEGCTAIIGVDAHHPRWLQTPVYYHEASEFLRKLGIRMIDTI